MRNLLSDKRMLDGSYQFPRESINNKSNVNSELNIQFRMPDERERIQED